MVLLRRRIFIFIPLCGLQGTGAVEYYYSIDFTGPKRSICDINTGLRLHGEIDGDFYRIIGQRARASERNAISRRVEMVIGEK